MKDCQKIRKDLVAFLYGELGPEDAKRLKSHLDACPRCKDEAREVAFIKEGANAFSLDMTEAMESVDWEGLPEKIADRIFIEERPARPHRVKKVWNFLFLPGLKPVFAGILVGLIVGSLATYFIFRPPQLRTAKGPELFIPDEFLVVPDEFLEKAELEVARRETLDYLEKSQYLLLDFVQSVPGEPEALWKDKIAVEKARDLLSRKKFINPQLDKFRMAKAKEICDQIEFLFYELTQMSEYLSPEDLRRIQNLIEERQLMLKIKLVKKELKKSEV
ncbi:MAG: zf-HC2 domain-containing protein [Candidatus Aminicenantes bacterium]|jgi:hypothetical protein